MKVRSAVVACSLFSLLSGAPLLLTGCSDDTGASKPAVGASTSGDSKEMEQQRAAQAAFEKEQQAKKGK